MVVESPVVGLEVMPSEMEVGGMPVVSVVVGVVTDPLVVESTTPLEPEELSVALAEPAVSLPPHAGSSKAASNVRVNRFKFELPITHHPLDVTIPR
jgi:hypothetical protein